MASAGGPPISAKRHNVCECCLGSGIRAGLDHAVVSHEEFGAWIDGKAIEQGLQLGPESVAAPGAGLRHQIAPLTT
jgi:hypothetical protein